MAPFGKVNLTDEVFARGVDAWVDVDIDSNNDGGFSFPDGTAWEEELEDSNYGLGKLVLQSSSLLGGPAANLAPHFTPVVVKFPVNLDVDASFFKVRLDFDPSDSASGFINLWTADKTERNRIDTDATAGGQRSGKVSGTFWVAEYCLCWHRGNRGQKGTGKII